MSQSGNQKPGQDIPSSDPNHGNKSTPTHETIAEQTREAQQNQQAMNDQASIREKMVDIGRGGQQAGRQGDRK